MSKGIQTVALAAKSVVSAPHLKVMQRSTCSFQD